MKKLIIKGADFSNCALENTFEITDFELTFSKQTTGITNNSEIVAAGFNYVSNFIDISSYTSIGIYTRVNTSGNIAIGAIYKDNESSIEITDTKIIQSDSKVSAGFQKSIINKDFINQCVTDGYIYLQIQCYGEEHTSNCYIKGYVE